MIRFISDRIRSGFLAHIMIVALFASPPILSAQAKSERPPKKPSARPSTGAWHTRSSKDALTDSVRFSIYVDADEPVLVNYKTITPRLAVQCHSGELNIAFYVGVPSNDEEMQLRFDSAEILTLSMDKSTNLEWLFVSTYDSPTVKDILPRFAQARRLRARFTPFVASPVTFSFEVAGLTPLLPQLEKAGCQLKEPSVATDDTATDHSDRPLGGATKESDGQQTYFEFQVDKPAEIAAGSPRAKYPSVLESSGIAGEVQVQFVVKSSGLADMDTFKVLKSTNELFTQAVRNVLPRISFTPATLAGKSVNQLVQQSFHFAVAR